ncbi:polysaccharide deacetylase family protein [Prosthecomicrobium sp. N25]|uniref:polysaccharide deacetylase family protein n=1 Tax=Prosthecomicrobium sp. N25 TaxID=3129254 RepID=UPI003076D2BC
MSLRGRAAALARRIRLLIGAERPIVLMYHRVETLQVDPWRLAVAPDRFARQIALLSRRRRVVPLSWLAGELAAGRLPRHVAAVTFDDGYADLYRNALPVLAAARCPATVFVTTGATDRPDGFWWDALTRLVLETPVLPPRLDLAAGGLRVAGAVPEDPAGRGALLAAIHGPLRVAGEAARRDAMAALHDWAGLAPEPRPRDRAMTSAEIAAMAASGWVEIGGHTVTHPSLPALSPEAAAAEVREGRECCRALSGQPVTGFAYPFGDQDPAVRAAVREAGFGHAVTTVAAPARAGTDPLAIPRLLAADWDEETFAQEVLRHG